MAELQDLVDTLPTYDNSSDGFDNLELFLCGVNSSDTGLFDVLKRFTQGDTYRQGQLVVNGTHTVELGHYGANDSVPCREVVLISEVK